MLRSKKLLCAVYFAFEWRNETKFREEMKAINSSTLCKISWLLRSSFCVLFWNFYHDAQASANTFKIIGWKKSINDNQSISERIIFNLFIVESTKNMKLYQFIYFSQYCECDTHGLFYAFVWMTSNWPMRISRHECWKNFKFVLFVCNFFYCFTYFMKKILQALTEV